MTHQTNRGFAVQLAAKPTDQNEPHSQNNAQGHTPLSQSLKLISKAPPQPQAGQVQVEVLASVVNPSDLVFLQGNYGVTPENNLFAGFEGCGIVRQANAGLYGKWLIGKRVAMAAQAGFDGFWGNTTVTKATNCLPIRDSLTNEQGATLIVNPMTSVCLVERAKALKSPAIIVNAAASQVGKGVIRYAQQANVKVIATVRSEANVAVVKALGADEVLLTSDEHYPQALEQVANKLNARVLIDAVAAQQTAAVMRLMPPRSTAIVYGRLTDTHSKYGGEYGVADLIFRDCRIEGFWLATFMRRASVWQIMQLSRKVQSLFEQGIFNTDIYATVGFDDFLPALDYYADNKSAGKVIFVPQ